MKWVKRYQGKARRCKLTCFGLLILVVLLNVCCFLYAEKQHELYKYNYYGYDDRWLIPVVVISIPIAIFLFSIMIAQFRVAWRKYNGNYIISYTGLTKGYLIINDEVQCIGGIFQYDFYGQLPDGTDVYAKVSPWSGSVKFSIGSTNNHNINFL